MGGKEKKELIANKDVPLLTKTSLLYGDSTLTRSLILSIPNFGSSIDLMLIKKGQKYLQERIEFFLKELSSRLKRVENQIVNIQDEEGLFDIMQAAYDQVVRSRSKRKIERFAQLISDYVVSESNWDETEVLIKLVGELSDMHVDILNFTIGVPRTWGNRRVVYLGGGRVLQENIPALGDHFPNFSESALKMYCSELISRGLLYDEGLRGAGLGAMEYVVPTDLAVWFLDKIKESNI